MSSGRKLTRGTKLVVASHNAGKVREINSLIAPFGLEAVSAGALGLAEPDETGTMFASNARIKSRAAAQASGLPALADDSGICIDALDGAPGIFSARWGGAAKDFGAAMERVQRELQGKTTVFIASTSREMSTTSIDCSEPVSVSALAVDPTP